METQQGSVWRMKGNIPSIQFDKIDCILSYKIKMKNLCKTRFDNVMIKSMSGAGLFITINTVFITHHKMGLEGDISFHNNWC